jgi:branched-chain amino acid transport system ATP-binding protein
MEGLVILSRVKSNLEPPMLELDDIRVNYGAAPALWGVSLQVAKGELVCVVGPNGAGKSTLINAIAGVHKAHSGRLSFEGRDLAALPSHRFCEAGIAIVPEGRRLFVQMTVLENLELGSFIASAKALRRQTLDEVLSRFPALKEKLNQAAGSLSGGQQQMVAIGRAMMARPRLLLLDEPSLGLAPVIVDEMFRVIRDINAQGTSVLLVEQNVSIALRLAKRAYVLEEGRIAAQGEAGEMLNRPEIRKAYLGL